MLIERQALCALIPHAGAMCLLDGVLAWDETRILCQSESHRKPNNPLYKDGQLSAVHAVEYGAQAMAVHGSLLAIDFQKNIWSQTSEVLETSEVFRELIYLNVYSTGNKKVTKGYLAAIRDIELYVLRLDDIVKPLSIEAKSIICDEHHLMYALNISAGGKKLVTGRATVVQVS